VAGNTLNAMSVVSDFLTQPGFWWGVPLGAVVTGVVAPIITARSVRASDKRKADQDVKMQALKVEQDEKMQVRKEEREDKLRDQERLYTAATDFVEVANDIVVSSIDVKGIFNALRDMFYDRVGMADPMADAKMDHGEKVMAQMMRIAVPVNTLKLVAPVDVLDSAMRTFEAVKTLIQQTTEPFAKPIAHQAAAAELNNFYNVFRQAVGREPYTDERARDQALSFMETLKKQRDDYIEEAKAEMKAAGFKTTPWDKRTADDGSPQPDDEAGRFGLVEPEAVPITTIKAGDLTEDHVGKFLRCQDSALGLNYGAKMLKVIRVEEGSRPSMLVRIQHPPMPGGKLAHQERIRLSFEQEIQLVKLPTQDGDS
jgi:hypothetical protein